MSILKLVVSKEDIKDFFNHNSILRISNFELLFLCTDYFYKYVINSIGIFSLFKQTVSQSVKRIDNNTAFAIIKCNIKHSFHMLSSFEYIVARNVLKIECADFKSKKKGINLSSDTLVSTFAMPRMY